MTLLNGNSIFIEEGQAAAIASAGGMHLEGFFSLTCTGWEVTIRKLTLNECVKIAGAARKILEPASEELSGINAQVAMLLSTYGLEEVMAEVTRQWRMSQTPPTSES